MKEKETVKKKATSTKKTVAKPKVVKAEVIVEEVKAEPTIFDKYREHINRAKDGTVKNLSYSDAMEMLRHIEKLTNRKIGLNMNCAACMMELVEMFVRLEK